MLTWPVRSPKTKCGKITTTCATLLPQIFQSATEIAPPFIDLGVSLPRIVRGVFKGICGDDRAMAKTWFVSRVCETRLEELWERPSGLRGIIVEKLRPCGW